MEEYETVTLILNTLDISTSQNPLDYNEAGAIKIIDNQYGTITNNNFIN